VIARKKNAVQSHGQDGNDLAPFGGLRLRHLAAGVDHCVGRFPAKAQSADLVLCDRLAADPADPDKPADLNGTREIAQADIATAIKFLPDRVGDVTPGALPAGRAYAANQQLPEAIGAYRKAADKGSTSAMVELGVMHANRVSVPKDEVQGAQAVRARRRGRQPARGQQSGGPPQQRRRAVGSRQGQSLAVAGGRDLGGSAISARIDDGGRHWRPQDDVAARTLFEKAAATKPSRCIGADGRLRAKRARRRADSSAAKAYYAKGRGVGNEEAKVALKRLECPYVLKASAANS